MSPDTELAADILVTGDGSLTYKHPRHGATYRSTNGAATESRHVFVGGCQLVKRPDSWSVLELGFGTGLNFTQTVEAADRAQVSLVYVSLEPEPLARNLWLVDDCYRDLEWGEPRTSDNVTLTVHRSRWQDFTPQAAAFDAIYHDPFGPGEAPECWTSDCFAWAAQALKPHGILSTFGASSSARLAMKEASLLVASLPGAPGKREMTIAGHCAESLAHAKPWKRN